MKRFTMLFSMTLLLLSAIVVMGRSDNGVSAQDSAAIHPIVGTWLANADAAYTDLATDVFQFRADGTYSGVDADGAVELGQWEATGASTANLFILSTEADEDGNYLDSVIIRASIEVAADAQSFTASYTFEVRQADGTTTGEVGPGKAVGTRIVLEVQGEPVMSMDEAFAMFGEDEEATPVP